jgi:hypothetical protein
MRRASTPKRAVDSGPTGAAERGEGEVVDRPLLVAPLPLPELPLLGDANSLSTCWKLFFIEAEADAEEVVDVAGFEEGDDGDGVVERGLDGRCLFALFKMAAAAAAAAGVTGEGEDGFDDTPEGRVIGFALRGFARAPEPSEVVIEGPCAGAIGFAGSALFTLFVSFELEEGAVENLQDSIQLRFRRI